MPEVIDDGVTGYTVNGVEAAVEAVSVAARLDRGMVAARSRERFSAERMVDEYLRVYERLLAR
jgi:glycosyltransferase involved in cell wall biosynthesis